MKTILIFLLMTSIAKLVVAQQTIIAYQTFDFNRHTSDIADIRYKEDFETIEEKIARLTKEVRTLEEKANIYIKSGVYEETKSSALVTELDSLNEHLSLVLNAYTELFALPQNVAFKNAFLTLQKDLQLLNVGISDLLPKITAEYKTFDFTWHIYDMPDMRYKKIHPLLEITKDVSQQVSFLHYKTGGVITYKEYLLFKECIEFMAAMDIYSLKGQYKKHTITKKITLKKETTLVNGKKSVAFYIIIPKIDGTDHFDYVTETKPTTDLPFYTTETILPFRDSMTSDSTFQTIFFDDIPRVNSNREIAVQSAMFSYQVAYKNKFDRLSSNEMIFYLRLVYPQQVSYVHFLNYLTYNNHEPWDKRYQPATFFTFYSMEYYRFHIVDLPKKKKHLRITLSSASKTVDEINKFIYPNYIMFKPHY